MAGVTVQADPRLIKAIAHPLRHRILLALGEGVSSPNQIAAELGVPLGRVSHHVRVLKSLGAVELVRTEPRRGALEHFYRATMQPFFDDATWAALPRATRRAFSAQGLGRLLEDLAEAATGRGFDHPRAHLSYVVLDLDERGFAEIADILAEALQRVLDVKSATEQRVSMKGGQTAPSEVALLHFERES